MKIYTFSNKIAYFFNKYVPYFQLRLEQEKKEKRKLKEKEKRERLKAEGKLLTKTQKQNRARMEATLAALRQQGMILISLYL